MKNDIARRLRSILPLVHIVLSEATRRRASGALSDVLYEEQIRRLAREELAPHGLELLLRELAPGRTRFIIKEAATGLLCDILTFDEKGIRKFDSTDVLNTPALTQ